MDKSILTTKQLALKELSEFLESELGDYSFTWKIENDDSYDEHNEIYFKVNYSNRTMTEHTLNFKYLIDEDILYINMYDDHYEEVNTYSHRVKYLWINVKWD